MPATVVSLFRTRLEAEAALGKLKEAGFGQDRVSVSTPSRRRRGRYGLKVATGIVALPHQRGRAAPGGGARRAASCGAMEAEPVEAPLDGGRPWPESG